MSTESTGPASAFAAAQLTRATGAGLDPHAYLRATAGAASVGAWSEALIRTARQYVARAGQAAAPGSPASQAAAVSAVPAVSTVSAGEYEQAAARWYHFATLSPHAAGSTHHAYAAAEADAAMGRALALLEPGARRLEGPAFTGWLRGPADAPSTVIVVPGLDSGKEEFHRVTAALLRRGSAVFTMDGPGQGALAASTTLRADYDRVIGQVIDALALDRVGLIGLSLGGYYVARTAALEPRVAAAAVVSGPHRLDWDALPPPLQDLLTQRAGGADAAREFTAEVDLSALAPRIACPLLVVDGGEDRVPGVTNGAELARQAPNGDHLLIPQGDHLLGNAQPDWLPTTTDWLTTTLGFRGAAVSSPCAGGPVRP
ncbi:S9 family peptidase [Streptomyces sp. NBC_00347]|uniref:alpha/beta hydrolase family protein n=1 Tax=Streptomyces sp. NBC_00347 TaxID=2975721 RepID=UPI0022566C86|nr:alpha/beta fold hydrolase [Streptomyces sp. NBC_00347]MCX5128612.1 esterase FrsA [Streptomyces sp. NBC_00347]